MKIKNRVLVDKDGGPVNHFEGADYRIINHQRESFPMPINEDGTIRLPTPKEMEQMRAQGQAQQDLSPLLSGEMDLESEIPTPPNPTLQTEEESLCIGSGGDGSNCQI